MKKKGVTISLLLAIGNGHSFKLPNLSLPKWLKAGTATTTDSSSNATDVSSIQTTGSTNTEDTASTQNTSTSNALTNQSTSTPATTVLTQSIITSTGPTALSTTASSSKPFYRFQTKVSILEEVSAKGAEVMSKTIDGTDVKVNTIYQMFNLDKDKKIIKDNFFYFTPELNKGPQANVIQLKESEIQDIQIDAKEQMFILIDDKKYEIDLLVGCNANTFLAIDFDKEDLSKLETTAKGNTSIALRSAAFLTKVSAFTKSSAALVKTVGKIAQTGTELASKLVKDADKKQALEQAAKVIGTATDKASNALNQASEKAAILAEQAKKNQEMIDLAAKAGQALTQATVDKVINPLIDKQIAAGTASETAIKIRDKLDGFNAEKATDSAFTKAENTLKEGQRIVDVSQKAADSIGKDVTNANNNSGSTLSIITSLTNATTTLVKTIPQIFDRPSPKPTPAPIPNHFKVSLPDNYDTKTQKPK